jgi:hypothetical protein
VAVVHESGLLVQRADMRPLPGNAVDAGHRQLTARALAREQPPLQRSRCAAAATRVVLQRHQGHAFPHPRVHEELTGLALQVAEQRRHRYARAGLR